MQKICRQCKTSFEITDQDLLFYDKISPVFAGKKYSIPSPTLCPDCRQQRRLAFRNERKLYHRKCDLTGQQIISIYSPDKPYKVYDQKEWWGDKWDALDYGRPYDFNKSFFEQFDELMKAVPRPGVLQLNNENSLYTNCVTHLKDCYLVFSADFNQDCYYGVWIEKSRDCCDNLIVDSSQLTYESAFVKNIYNGVFIFFSSQCSDSAFLYDCKNCSNCFLSSNLRNKQYYILNQPYSREEYLEKIKFFPLTSYKILSECKDRFLKLMIESKHLFRKQMGRTIDSSGDFLIDVMNCADCYEIIEARDCRYSQGIFSGKDLVDCCYVNGELGYENCECVPGPFCSAFNINSYSGNNLYYCDHAMNNSSYLFACIGVRRKKYCILNKQYTKEEYESLVPRIIEHMSTTGEWGEFFPIEISPFGYNETVAQDYFPMNKEAVLAKNWKCSEEEEQSQKYLGSKYEIPDSINDVDESICGKILLCEVTGKPYKIIPQELAFYKKMNLPIPRKCPDQRHKERLALRNPRKLFDRTCSKCQKAIKTTYAPDRPEIVYCEECYLKEVY